MLETIHLQMLLATFAAWSNRQQAKLIASLVEENRVLEEQLEVGGWRFRFADDQRRRPGGVSCAVSIECSDTKRSDWLRSGVQALFGTDTH